MKIAEEQACWSNFYHFDRQKKDTIHICGKVSDTWIDKINAYLTDPVMPEYDIKYNEIYKQSLNNYHNNFLDISYSEQHGYNELSDTYQSLKNAGYPDDFVSFQCINVPKTHEIDKIGKLFPFNTYNTRFSVLKGHSISIYHLDHNFIANEDGSKKYVGGFHKDYRCRKFLIALDNSYDNPENAFYFGSAPWIWRKGDIVPLDNAIPHYGANFGNKTRSFFMITGTVNVEKYNDFCNQWNEIK